VTTEEKEAARKESEAKKKEKDAKKAEEKAAKQRQKEKSVPKISKTEVEDGWALAGAGAVKKPIKGKAGKPPAMLKSPPKAAVKTGMGVTAITAQKRAGGFAALMGGDSDSDSGDEDETAAEAEAEPLPSPTASDEGAAAGSAAEQSEELVKGFVPKGSSSLVSDELLVKKTQSLLDEYWSAQDVEEAVLCVRELSAPQFHPQLVCQVLTSVLERKDIHRELAVIMLNRLWSEGLVTESQLQTGIQDVASLIEDLEIDIPLAGRLIMQMIGKLIAFGCVRLGTIPRILPFFAESKIESLLGELCSAVEGASNVGKLQELYDAEESRPFPFGFKLSGCKLVPLSAH
jgi:hypothetical protein